jgi:GT2 family glycosyltransferase
VPLVDAVVVSYRSRDRLRACVEPLAAIPWVEPIVVDNASDDGSLAAVAGLRGVFLQLEQNGGFAFGCNAGWRTGSSPFVLLLNPDARIGESSLRLLVHALERDVSLGAVAPRIVGEDGRLDHSQRRFPRLRSTYAQALFLHRLLPAARWVDEVVRDQGAYTRSGSPEWVSGACILVRRAVLEQLGGLDEGFFLYCEDTDLCRRIHGLGLGLRYDPAATATHAGGASAPRAELLAVLATSRVRYARIHRGRAAAALDRVGIALGAFTHALASSQGRAIRSGHARALRSALTGSAR